MVSDSVVRLFWATHIPLLIGNNLCGNQLVLAIFGEGAQVNRVGAILHMHLTQDTKITLEGPSIEAGFENTVSSIGRVFRSPLRSEEENGGPSASGRHLG